MSETMSAKLRDGAIDRRAFVIPLASVVAVQMGILAWAPLILREILTDADDLLWLAVGFAAGALVSAAAFAFIWWRLLRSSGKRT